jgi:type III secretion protein J
MRRTLIVIASCLVLTACGHETLYAELDEQQANEMLAALVGDGVDAGKVRNEKGWSIEVGRSDLPEAMRVLKAEGLPREHFDSLGQVFKKEGFVSTPLEERARLLYALSQELSHTVSAIDGVVVARVHLAIPERRPLSDEKPLSSAAVFIKYKPGSQVVNKAASIKALIVNSVEGLPYENVTVTFFASDAPQMTAQTAQRSRS